jgi:DNA replication and repair protein RecF
LEPANDLREVELLYRQRYNETRARDRQAGFTLDGPHRHDVSLRCEGREARYLLSSGQAKVVAAALRLATLACVEREHGEHYPVIVDDIDAELDRGALERLLRFLGTERQVLMSSTSEQVAEVAGHGTQRLRLDNGIVVPREISLNG